MRRRLAHTVAHASTNTWVKRSVNNVCGSDCWHLGKCKPRRLRFSPSDSAAGSDTAPCTCWARARSNTSCANGCSIPANSPGTSMKTARSATLPAGKAGIELQPVSIARQSAAVVDRPRPALPPKRELTATPGHPMTTLTARHRQRRSSSEPRLAPQLRHLRHPASRGDAYTPFEVFSIMEERIDLRGLARRRGSRPNGQRADPSRYTSGPTSTPNLRISVTL